MSVGNFFEKTKRNPKTTIITLVLVALLVVLGVLLVVFFRSQKPNVEKDDFQYGDYFANSIITLARKRELSLLAGMTILDVKTLSNGKKKEIKYEIMNTINSVYDFKTKILKQQLSNYEDGEKTWTRDVYTIDGLSEVYEIDYDESLCDSYDEKSSKTVAGFHLIHYMPKELIDLNVEHIMLNPNYLLYYMFSEYRGVTVDVKCKKIEEPEIKDNPVKCEIINDQTVKVEYYFKNVDNHTMYPTSIEIFKRPVADQEWHYYRSIAYNLFEVQLDGKTLVDHNLPIGLQCDRKSKNKYTNLMPSFGDPEFFFDYDLSLTYNSSDGKTDRQVLKKYSGSMYRALSDFKAKTYMEPYTFVHHGVNEETNKKMITFYNKHLKTFYDYYPDNDGGQCSHLSESKSINWFYWFDLFVKNVEIFDFGYKFASYIGRFNIDEIDSYVYERTLGGFGRLFDDDKPALQVGHSDNMNKISSDDMVAIYYYHAKASEDLPFVTPLSMPFKMEFRLKGNDGKTDVGKLVLDTKNYYPGILDYEKAFESSKNCIESSDYDRIVIKYTGDLSDLEDIKDIEHETKQTFRKMINEFISPLRANEFNVKFTKAADGDSIFVDFRLYDPSDAESHFNVTEGEGMLCLGNKRFFDGHDHKVCAQSCLEDQDCGVYAFQESKKNCLMCVIENFNDLWFKFGKELDYSQYIEVRKNEEFKLGKKSAYFFYAKHASNLDVLSEIRERAYAGNLDLILKTDEGGIFDTRFKLVDLKSKRVKENE